MKIIHQKKRKTKQKSTIDFISSFFSYEKENKIFQYRNFSAKVDKEITHTHTNTEIYSSSFSSSSWIRYETHAHQSIERKRSCPSNWLCYSLLAI